MLDNDLFHRCCHDGSLDQPCLSLNKVDVPVDEDVDGSYKKKRNEGRTSLLSPGLRAMAGWHDGPGV
jgi:hypothetical protein